MYTGSDLARRSSACSLGRGGAVSLTAAHAVAGCAHQVDVGPQREIRIVVAQVLGERPDVHAVVQAGGREVVPESVEPVLPRSSDAGLFQGRLPEVAVDVVAVQRGAFP